MNALVVFESMYGNTHAVADAIATGLAEHADSRTCPFSEAGDLEGVDLLVVGGPTHMHGMTSSRSRKIAVDDAASKHLDLDPAVGDTGLRDWLDALERVSGIRAAAFDTRLDGPKILTGSAARGIAHRLGRHGYDVVAEESFLMEDTHLREGELDRATGWGRRLASGVLSRR